MYNDHRMSGVVGKNTYHLLFALEMLQANVAMNI